VLINTASAYVNVSQQAHRRGHRVRGVRAPALHKFILPAALPYMMTGCASASAGPSSAWGRRVFTALTGLGALIVKYGNQFDTASMFVPILVLMLLGILLTAGIRRMEARIAPWKETEREVISSSR